MAEDIEQPEAASAPDEVNAPAVPSPEDAAPADAEEAAPEQEAPKPPKSGARERIAQLVADRNRESQARAEAERKAQEYERRLQQLQTPVAEDPYADDPFARELLTQRAMLEEMRRDTAYVKDVRAREEFWAANDVAPDLVEAVETQLADFRARGMDKIRREDLLAYQVGSRELSRMKTKVKQPAPPVNRVAVVEGGATTRPPSGSKNPEDMTLAELREYMKGKTF